MSQPTPSGPPGGALRMRVLSVTVPYLLFSVTDGAIRMLVVLHFHDKGFTPFQVASLFLLYEIAGVVTNLLGGWIGARLGLSVTFLSGFACQLLAMALLTMPEALLTVPYTMVTQGFSGIAKDLVKVSSKSSLKVLIPSGADSSLFRSVSLLTGSKNSFKGLGFLLGGLMMALFGLQGSMAIMAICLGVSALVTLPALPSRLGQVKTRVKFRAMFSKTPEINVLSAARFFLFGSRDVWFVIGLPVYLYAVLGWHYPNVGAFLGMWIVFYGIAQSVVPKVLDGASLALAMGRNSVAVWTGSLMVFPLGIIVGLGSGLPAQLVLMVGLMLYGVFFAVNSIIHSYLVLAYSDAEKAASDVGFYYMANACGRLVGSLMSGWVYQQHGLVGCLAWSAGFLASAALVSLWLPVRSVNQ